MIGIINSLLFDYVEARYGKERQLEIKRDLGMSEDETFRIDTYYSDDEWQKFYARTVELLGENADKFEWDFGRYSGEKLVAQFPTFVRGCNSARDMIVRQPKIHYAIGNSVTDPAKRDVVNRKFNLEELDGQIVMHYVSHNHMCTFYRSLATWVGEHFGETVLIDEPHCQKRGDHECEIHLRYSKN